MAEPIQQLTRNNNPQERQTIPFTLIQRKEKVLLPFPAWLQAGLALLAPLNLLLTVEDCEHQVQSVVTVPLPLLWNTPSLVHV